MRIAIVIYSMQAGGAERVTANLANAWADRGWDVSIVTLSSGELAFPLRARVTRVALDVAYDSANIIGAVAANVIRIRVLRRALQKLKPDIAIGMMTTAGVLTAFAARGLSCRVVVSERSDPKGAPSTVMWSVLRRIAYAGVSCVVMLSQDGLDWLRSNAPGARGMIIPNPVLFPLPLAEPTIPPDILLGRHLLLTVGRLHRVKGFDLLLESFAKISCRHPSWDLVLLGEGPERSVLERRIAELGLKGRVRLPGRAGNVGDWYNRANLYVLSSRLEGFPNSLVEAMAHGCAVIGYDCNSALREIVRHEENGLLISPVGDVPALAEALDRLMGNESERTRMAMQALHVRKRFSMEQVLSRWDDLLQASA